MFFIIERQEAFASWDPVDPVNVDWGDDSAGAPAASETPYDQSAAADTAADSGVTGVKCVALYSYTVSVDESFLNIVGG